MATTTDPTTKAMRLAEQELAAIGFDLDRNSRQTIQSIEERHDLLERRKRVLRLYEMLGGDPQAVAMERMG
jgi:hypothetical protein